MLSVNEIINNLVSKFQANAEHDILFKITPYLQQWYDTDVKDQDGKSYIAGVLYEQTMPKITTFYTTRAREFTIQLKGLRDDEKRVESIINTELKFKIDNNEYVLSNFIVDEVKQETDRFGVKQRVFYATIRLTLYVPTFITGSDITVKIDDEEVRVIGGNGIFDKGLISTVDFGDNISEINTGSEFVLRFALGTNTKENEIFSYVINKIYNKQFNFKFDFVVATMNVDLVLRSGIVNWNADSNTVEYSATFERALERKEIKINGNKIVALAFTPQQTATPIVSNENIITKVRNGKTSKVFSLVLENDNSTVINELIEEFKTPNNKKFTLEYEINNHLITTDCVLNSILFITNENANAVINITLMEGKFYGGI